MRIKRIRKPGLIGKIKVGEKRISKNGREYPTSLDYFRATSKVKSFEDVFNTHYNKANELRIAFATNDHNFNMIHCYELRDHAGKEVARGDGELFEISTMEGWLQRSEAEIIQKYGSADAFFEKSAKYYRGTWSESLTMRFLIKNINILGVWEFKTKGAKSSVGQIVDTYEHTRRLLEQNGENVAGKEFIFRVDKVQNARRLDKNRSYSVVSLHPVVTQIDFDQILLLQ